MRPAFLQNHHLMENFDRHRHWENVYRTRKLTEVGWYQAKPVTSLEFIGEFSVPLSAKIIDIGGGDSFLVDHLLEIGYQDVTVLDISETAVERAKARLGPMALKVKWIIEDAAQFKPAEKYDLWHDRAAFHFFTEEKEIEKYVDIVRQSLNPNGVLILGTFSEQGPEKCSGINIRQYSEISMTERFKRFFEKIRCVTVDHITPFNTVQNFVFCSFRKFQAA